MFVSLLRIFYNLYNRVKPEYYYPTLHQIQVELEDGKTEDGDAIRFDYQEKKFPGYSWKGFVFINEEQVYSKSPMNDLKTSLRLIMKISIFYNKGIPDSIPLSFTIYFLACCGCFYQDISFNKVCCTLQVHFKSNRRGFWAT